MRILVIEDEMVSREKLRLIMTHFGDVVAVQSGNEGLAALSAALEQRDPFGLIMLDIHMPEKDGIQVLLEIRAKENELKLPRKERVIILMVTAQTDKSRIVSCVQAGCDGYIAKPFNLPVINEKLLKFGIHKIPAKPEDSTEQKPALAEDSQLDILKEATAYLNRGEIHLPTLPRIHRKFKDMSRAGQGYRLIADLLRKDLALSAELIRLSNSAYFRGFLENKSLEQAVLRLGFAAAEKIIEDLCSRKLYSMTCKSYRQVIEPLLLHSLACAFSCEAIAKSKNLELDVDPFTLGLLHDIGKLALLQVLSELENKGRLNGELSTDQITKWLHADHESFGSQLLEKWKYSDTYVQTVRYHNRLDQVEQITTALGLVYLGNKVAKTLGFSLESGNGTSGDGESGDETADVLSDELKPDAETLEQVSNATLDYMATVKMLF